MRCPRGTILHLREIPLNRSEAIAMPAFKLRHSMVGIDSIRFGEAGRFELQPRRRRLLADGAAVKLGARAFDLLALLLAERERSWRGKNCSNACGPASS
ncbi:MAG: hypothetical protein IPM99_27305 [Rubrivivax sp.]|nr:hypothetical protein [Rubrivivax sp.]